MSEAFDTESGKRLVAYIKRVMALREERADITADIRGVLSEAKTAGFDKKRISDVCRWIEQVDKHGRDQVDHAELIFQLYREIYDGRQAAELLSGATADAKLAAAFGAPAPAKPKKISSTVEKLRAEAEAARKALGEE